jgi:hypothetical protein
MKIRIISFLLGAVVILLCLQSASGGRAANGEMDKTGAPGSLGSCGGYCHGSAGLFLNTQLNVVVKDANGNIVNSYVPGQVYTLEFDITSDGSPVGYGMQAVILDSLDMNAGDMLTVSTSETQLTTIPNGREFIEHQGISNTGVFKTTWMAPAIGTGEVTLYGVGMAVNGSGTTQGDDFSQAMPLVLSEDITNSTLALEEAENAYDIFPNPNQGAFYVKSAKESNCSIKVFNIAGQIVYEEFIELAKYATHQINLNGSMTGVYWVEIENGSTKKSYPMRVY